jgi:hypothetical protein
VDCGHTADMHNVFCREEESVGPRVPNIRAANQAGSNSTAASASFMRVQVVIEPPCCSPSPLAGPHMQAKPGAVCQRGASTTALGSLSDRPERQSSGPPRQGRQSNRHSLKPCQRHCPRLGSASIDHTCTRTRPQTVLAGAAAPKRDRLRHESILPNCWHVRSARAYAAFRQFWRAWEGRPLPASSAWSRATA